MSFSPCFQFSTNGLISFDTSFTSFSHQPFPGFVGTRYLVAPYWDDADTSGGNGQIYYEVHESGHYINQVNSYLNTVRPSRFEGTWMLVITWDGIHPWPGSSRTEVCYILLLQKLCDTNQLLLAGKYIPNHSDL